MKKNFLTFIFLFVFGFTFAQEYTMDQVNGMTINGCGGHFYDSGGFVEHC